MWTPPQKLGCLDDVTLEDVQQFSYKLFRHVFVEGFIYGNVMKEDAVNTISKVAVQLRNKMGATKLAPGQASRTRQYAIPDTPGGLKLFSHNLVHTSCAVEFYLQFGPQNLHDNTVLDLFLQIISEPCFNVLRTKEQLGYIIRRSVRRSGAWAYGKE
jgi:insulysin